MPEEEDSGVVSLAEVNAERDALTQTRKQMIVEHQRAKGADHYAVLMVNRRATAQEIDTASGIRANLLEHQEGILTDPRDRAKIGELRELYAAARSVLLDDRKRAAYDRELAGGELVQVPPAIDTELNFRVAEELIGKRQWSQAINMIRTVISRSPGEADYHAALGWAEWNAGERAPEAADRARPHLNAALEINPDHAAAHDYKGQIDAALRSDDAEALFHLERALDLDPSRIEAVQAVETLLFARGELRRYERLLKRLLFRLRGRGTTAEAKAWGSPRAPLSRPPRRSAGQRRGGCEREADQPEGLRRHRPDPARQPQRTAARGLARGAARSAIGRGAGQDHRGERARRCRVPGRGHDGRAAHRRRPDGEGLRDAPRADDLDPRAAARSRSVGAAPPQGRQPRARWPDRAGRARGPRDRADDARR
jgi:tetratricopeptide (TPR) repeat protein